MAKHKTLKSQYYHIPTTLGSLHIHVDYDETGPKKVFTQMPPVGSDWSNVTSLIGILITKYIEATGDTVSIIRHLSSIKGTRIGYIDDMAIESIPQAIGIVLRRHMEHHHPKLITEAPAAAEAAPLA
jgi:hypothetical protein